MLKMFLNKLKIIFAGLNYVFFGKKYIAIVDITDKCNLFCQYCYHRNDISSGDNINFGEWEKRFKKYKKMGIRHVTFVGGEPSLRCDILKLAEDYFPFVRFITNGQIRVPEEFTHQIFLSLDGLEEPHDNIHGAGTFKKAVDNYRNNKKVVVFSTFSNLNYKNPQYLREFIDFVRGMNVFGLKFSFYIPAGKEDDNFILNNRQRSEICEVFLEELRRGDSILLMSRGMIDFLSQPFFSPDRCAYKKMAYCFDNKNEQKNCPVPSMDCSRCGCAGRYEEPISLSKNWLSYILMLLKYI